MPFSPIGSTSFGSLSRRSLLVAALSLPLPLLWACEQAEAPPEEHQGYTVLDSSGVTIVESTKPAWAQGEGWTLSPEPVLSIGETDGPEEYMLFRASFATRLEDDRILVANSGTNELRYFGTDGRFLFSVGAEGDGPGEFRGLGFIFPYSPDSLAIPDYGLFRISIFDLDGNFGRAFRMGEGSGELPFPDGFFADRTALASARGGDAPDYTELGPFRDRVEYRQYGPEGSLVRRLTTLPGSEMYRGTHPDGSGYTTNRSYSVRPWAVAGPSSWFYGAGDAFEIQEWSQDGDLRKIMRLARERRAMPQELIDAREERLREMSPERAARSSAIPFPEYLPAHEWITVDRVGNLWMAEYVVLDEAPTWIVFDPSGHWLGEVEVPPNGRVSEIGEDYVLGVWRNELDVETVRMYRLSKPGSGEAP